MLWLKILFTFLATEIDDFLIFVLFFSECHDKKSKFSAFLGRLVSTLLVAGFCAFASQLLLKIPGNYLRFLGLIPLALGMIKIFKKADEDDEKVPETASVFMASFLLTCAASGDNLGVYIPFFVSMESAQKILTVLAFVFLQIFWTVLQVKSGNFPAVKKIVEKFGKILVPLVFILLGISIFFGL